MIIPTAERRVLWPGLLWVAGLTVTVFGLSALPVFRSVLPLSPLVLGILVGALVHNTLPLPKSTEAGIQFSARRILRLAIVFLGFRLSLSEVLQIGPAAVGIVVVGSASTLLLTILLGRRLGLSWKRGLLLGGGISICGAAAVAAINGAIHAQEEDVGFAIGSVTLFGTIFLFLYPFLFGLFHLPGMAYALWTGASIHEVAQVSAASAIAGEHLSALASTVKMVRVLLIVPVTLVLSFIPWAGKDQGTCRKRSRVSVPWFALGFFAVVVLNSLVPLPGGWRPAVNDFDNALMAAAMVGLGLEISVKSMMKSGSKAILVGLVSSVFLSGFSWLMVVSFL